MASEISKPLPYTADPLLLVLNDLMLFVQITFTWPVTAGLLSTILPLFPMRSGALDELGFTAANLWAILLHVVLLLVQTGFTLSLVPLALVGLPLFYILYIVGFVYVNTRASKLLNGPRRQGMYESHSDCIKGNWPDHGNEKWIFINGVAVGNHWLQSNLDLLAMTFRRPVFGIHNQTRGILFDVLECIIQRDLGFATTDIRAAYSTLLHVFSTESVHKVVLILHSQGGIEGGLVLDWLYDTLPADQLRKLEIYTFGNAANHWNAPVISARQDSITYANGPQARDPTPQRLVKHIEHYANEGDYVSKFGILHFRPDQARPQTSLAQVNSTKPEPSAPNPSQLIKQKAATYPRQQLSKLKTKQLSRAATWTPSPKTPMEHSEFQRAQENNRFFGRLFKRAASGHLLNQHYLDNMFQMEGVDPQDKSKGGVMEGNDFMDSNVDMDVFDVWDTVQAVGESQPTGSAGGMGTGSGRRTVKQLSRLWGYRNGMSPKH